MRYLFLLVVWIAMNNQASADPTYRGAYDPQDAQIARARYKATDNIITAQCAPCVASGAAWRAVQLTKEIANCNNPSMTPPYLAAKCVASWQIFFGW